MRDWISSTICAGLELEYEEVSVRASSEFAAARFPDGCLLDFKKDGSLRPRDRSTEIVFAAPLAGGRIDDALDQIDAMINGLPYSVSWRCGMHAHIDCRGMGWDMAYRAFLLSSLIEPLLYTWDGTGRKENKFCQSIVDSAGAFLLKDGGIQFTKYSLVNALSLGHLGSLELRFAASTRDVDRMAEYINLGMALRLCGEAFPTGEVLIESVLGARSMPAWLADHVPGIPGRRLSQIAAQLGYMFPPSSALFAAIALSEREPTLAAAVVGGKRPLRRILVEPGPDAIVEERLHIQNFLEAIRPREPENPIEDEDIHEDADAEFEQWILDQEREHAMEEAEEERERNNEF